VRAWLAALDGYTVDTSDRDGSPWQEITCGGRCCAEAPPGLVVLVLPLL
jgi:hypothetical protein